MGNVLDLKNPAEAEELSGTTTDVSAPVQSQSASDSDDAAFDDLAALMMSETVAPRTISWEAEHTLGGDAVRKHYLLLGGIAAVGGLIALWQASLTVFLVALAGVGALEARQRWSKSVRIDVDEHGIGIDGHQYAHADVASFDIHTMPDGATELSLHSGRWHMPHVRLPLGNQRAADVRAVLAQYIPEGRHPIPYLEHIIRKP